MKTVTINKNQVIGKIKDLNGVGGGPVSNNFNCDATELFREARIPYSRTHDIEYPFGAGEYVDIHCVFPNFKADPDDPESYNFVFTDAYLKAIVNAGTKPFYRLGTTIEHQPIKRYIFPPEDFEKWGKICSHIISHYNDGWADGFHMGIEYWEIWNEPDLKEKMWTGTEEEFFRFYDTASRIIKAEHPDIKIGGCGFCNSMTPMSDHFLAHIQQSGAPFDFFSWHGYLYTPKWARELAKSAEDQLNKYGFSHAESIYDEYNYVYHWDSTIKESIDLHRTAHVATLVSSVMTVLQKGRTDKAMYYDAQMVLPDWNGIFRKEIKVFGESYTILPEKPYYALKAWGMLKDLGNEVYSESNDDDVYVVAAADPNTLRILISYYNDDTGLRRTVLPQDRIRIDLGDLRPRRTEVRYLDNDRDFEPEELPDNILTLDGNSFALVTMDF